MKKRTFKKVLTLSICIVLLVVLVGFLALLIANDFSFDFTGLITPPVVEDPIIEDPINPILVFSFNDEEISTNDDLGSFEPDVLYSFIIPFEDYTYKITPNMDSSSSFDFYVDEALYNVLGEDDFSSGFTIVKDEENFSLSYESMYLIIKAIYPDNEIFIPMEDTSKYYGFKIVFEDEETSSLLVANFNIYVSEVLSVELETSEYSF